MQHMRSFVVLAAAALIAGCSGGGGSPTPSAPHQSSPGGTTSGNLIGAKLVFTIPARKQGSAKTRNANGKKRPAYVSPASLGAVVGATSSANSAHNELYGYALNSTNCTASETGTVCTLDIPLNPDTYAITISVYDADETSHASAPTGNLLSIDTENDTIASGVTNTLTNFLLHAQVDYFDGDSGETDNNFFGAVGGTALTPAPTYEFIAEDADGYGVDFYGNATTYHNAPLAANAADMGDTTGCTSFCFSATNDIGTSPGTPATISQQSDLSFALHYNGGGGPGTGVENSVAGHGSAPTGQKPYAGTITAVGAKGSYTASIVPLFAYPTSLNLTTNTGYVFAAQAAPPSTASQTGTSYAAYFGTPGTVSCSGDSGTVATIGTGTYYAGYGEVFPVTGVSPGSCTLTLTDGASPADTVTVPVTVSAGGTVISIPCPNGTGNPTGNAKVRRSSVFRRDATAPQPGPVPQLVQFATGVASVTLPNPVTAGDVLVIITGDAPGEPRYTNSGTPALTFDQFDDVGDLFIDLVTLDTSASAGTISANDSCNTAMWIGEFSGTAESSIEEANSGGSGTANGTTATIVPNALNGLVIAGSDNFDTTASTAPTGYTDYFQAGPETSVDVLLAQAGTTDNTDPISLTFGGQADSDETFIFQIPPSTFVGPAPSNPPAFTTKTKAYKLSHYRMLKAKYHLR